MRLTLAAARKLGIAPKSKYRNEKKLMCGQRFDSQKEAEYYLLLMDGKRRGVIRKIELQPEFVLQPGFRHDGKAEQAICYVADFRITYADGHVEVIDVKGYRTDVYRIKRKMLLYKYPEIFFKEA
jgi:hypothetical protein